MSKDFEVEKQQQKEKIQTILAKQTRLIRKREGMLLELLQLSVCKNAIDRVYGAQTSKLKQYQDQYAEYAKRRQQFENQKKELDKERETLKVTIGEKKVGKTNGMDISIIFTSRVGCSNVKSMRILPCVQRHVSR